MRGLSNRLRITSGRQVFIRCQLILKNPRLDLLQTMSCSELIKGLFAFSCLFISGCASMNVIKPSQVTNGRWDHILQSGISEDASHNLFLQKVNSQGKSQAFRPTDKQVTWWALFSMSSFPSPYHVVFQAKWYDPGGQIFFEEEFSLNSMMDSTFVKTSLPI